VQQNTHTGVIVFCRSHEIRHPIIGILSCAELLDATELSTEQQEFAAIMKTATEGLLSLVNDVLEVISEHLSICESALHFSSMCLFHCKDDQSI
jgi:signal transduction histidine kinase